MKHRMCILLLSASLCVPSALSCVPVAVYAETAAASDSASEDAQEQSQEKQDETQDTSDSQVLDAEETPAEEPVMDVEARKAIDEKTAENASFEPAIDPSEESAGKITGDEADESADDASEDPDVQAGGEGGSVINSSVIDMSDYFAFAKQMDDASDDTDITLNTEYTDGPMTFDIGTLSGMTDYRGPFSISVTDASGSVLYTLGFPKEVWNEDSIDLSAEVSADGNGQSLSFYTKQELPFMTAVSFTAVRKNARYLLTDSEGVEYGLEHSGNDGQIQFRISAFGDYTIKDARGHKYDSMDTGITDGDTWKSKVSKYSKVAVPVVIAVLMIVLACFAPVRKK